MDCPYNLVLHHCAISLQDDEYVVYSPDQVKLKYVVQFSIEGDKLKEFSPDIITADEPRLPSSIQGEPRTPEKYFKSLVFLWINRLNNMKTSLISAPEVIR